MEHISVILDPDSGKSFDEAVPGAGRLQDDGHLAIITKDKATVGGAPGACLTFGVQLPDGSIARAQTVVTVKLLQGALTLLKAKYPNL